MQSFELCMATDVLPGARQDENLPVKFRTCKILSTYGGGSATDRSKPIAATACCSFRAWH